MSMNPVYKTNPVIMQELGVIGTNPALIGAVSFKTRRIVHKEVDVIAPSEPNSESMPTLIAQGVTNALA